MLMNYDETIAEPNFFDSYESKKKTLEELMGKWENITIELDSI